VEQELHIRIKLIAKSSNPHVRIGSERNFGVVFSIFFLILCIYPLMNGNATNFNFLILFIITIIITLFRPRWLYWPNRVWFKFGLFIGNFVSPIVMSMIYFSILTPIGLALKLCGKDLLNERLDKNKSSYWIKRKTPIRSMKDQF
jgi:hypothetical protein